VAKYGLPILKTGYSKKPILNKNCPQEYILENWAIYYI
jgi:hypothetical protein